jgi:hypothetical protein
MVSTLARRSPASLFARTGRCSLFLGSVASSRPRFGLINASSTVFARTGRCSLFLGFVASSRPRFGLINESSTDEFYAQELPLALEPDLLSRAVFAEAVRADAGGRDPKE